MTNKIIILVTFILQLVASAVIGQDIASVKKLLKNINAAFDSTYFLSFKVNYNYHSIDYISGQEDSSQRQASYIVKGKSFFYDMGDVEYMQNDSLSFTISKTDRVIMFSKVLLPSASKSLPLSSITDNVLDKYALYYSITNSVDTSSNKGSIFFVALKGALVPYQQIKVDYTLHPAKLLGLTLNYKQQGSIKVLDKTGKYNGDTKGAMLNKTMVMDYTDYAFSNIDKGLFKREHYLYYDRQLHKYLPMPKYQGFKIYLNGIKEGY